MTSYVQHVRDSFSRVCGRGIQERPRLGATIRPNSMAIELIVEIAMRLPPTPRVISGPNGRVAVVCRTPALIDVYVLCMYGE